MRAHISDVEEQALEALELLRGDPQEARVVVRDRTSGGLVRSDGVYASQ